MLKKKAGLLEVVCGSMFSGKSEELIRRLKRAEIAKMNVIAFKHSLDDRKTTEHVISHNGTKIKAFAVHDSNEILKLAHDQIEVVGIDEVQFFPKDVIKIICKLIEDGKKVIVGGLDLDFRGIPFGPMPILMAIADKVTKLKAICIECGKDAQFSQRLVNGEPAKHNDPIILVGAEECYQARCRGCFVIDKVPELG
ncbi:thymidine kinase [candidate division TM6 bacterium RIFCSPHIGHO2_12_FULL_32_22]|nr:MAG: thymidine kinase [candidate division TM6 bacterium RIFCSPHIGHO2_12_FULL_32_22]